MTTDLHAVLTGAQWPVLHPLAHGLLRRQPASLSLCADLPQLEPLHDALLASQQQQAPDCDLRFCSFAGRSDLRSLHAALQCGPVSLLLHGAMQRSPAMAAADPCGAVEATLLLTRQVLQLAIATTPRYLVLLSSDLAGYPRTVQGATMAAAEASVAEAAALLPDLDVIVVRFPLVLEHAPGAATRAMRTLEQTWRLEVAARAVLHAITSISIQRQRLISWPDPHQAPQRLHSQPLASALRPPKQDLLTWLDQIREPMKRREQHAITVALRELWSHGRSTGRPKIS